MKLIITATLLLCTSTVTATIIRVPQDETTIQAGIDSAVAGDTVLVDTGRYVENINFNGKNIVVGSLFLTTGDTSYISQTVIDGDSDGSVVTFESGEDTNANLSGFTITRGRSYNGGGIYCDSSNPFLSHLIIKDNRAIISGGGIFCSQSSPTLSHIIINKNIASEYGGGIAIIESNPILEDLVISDNSSSSGGGGTYCSNSSPELIKVTIKENFSRFGGGIYFDNNATPIFNYESRCNIYQNFARKIIIDGEWLNAGEGGMLF